MAGHSHWANIKRTKGAADARRGRLSGKPAREAAMAAKLGGVLNAYADFHMTPELLAQAGTA